MPNLNDELTLKDEELISQKLKLESQLLFYIQLYLPSIDLKH